MIHWAIKKYSSSPVASATVVIKGLQHAVQVGDIKQNSRPEGKL